MNQDSILSSASLFHFFKKREYLADLLESGLQPRYTVENHPTIGWQLAIPMKCFCDIPLGSIRPHVNKYGRYGIGIKKDFAIQNGITPVFYVHHNSFPGHQTIAQTTPPEESVSNDPILPFYKSYQESFILTWKAESGEGGTIRYYDEREWRYCPTGMEIRFPPKKIEASDIEDYERHLNDNLDNETYRLKVPFSDISYIIVKNEEDVPKIIETIKEQKSNPEHIESLIAKIITTAQIFDDF